MLNSDFLQKDSSSEVGQHCSSFPVFHPNAGPFSLSLLISLFLRLLPLYLQSSQGWMDGEATQDNVTGIVMRKV